MQHLVATEQADTSVEATPETSRAATPTGQRNSGNKRRGGGGRPLRRDAELDALLQRQQKQLHTSPSFSKMAAIRKSLPAASAASEILELIRTNRVVIIAGETGCGKTTQVPQFILDQAIEAGSGSECNIVVTQPRRVSAIGVASRVAVERGEDLDGRRSPSRPEAWSATRSAASVGLLESAGCCSPRRVCCCDDWAQAETPISRASRTSWWTKCTERNVDSDFLLLELRELLKRNNKIKVILMSATINQETFASYFGRAPCISIPGRTFPVEDYYLEDILRESGFQPSGNEFRYGPRGGKQVEEEMGQLRTHLQAQHVDEETMRAVESISRPEAGSLRIDRRGGALRGGESRERRAQRSSGCQRRRCHFGLLSGCRRDSTSDRCDLDIAAWPEQGGHSAAARQSVARRTATGVSTCATRPPQDCGFDQRGRDVDHDSGCLVRRGHGPGQGDALRAGKRTDAPGRVLGLSSCVQATTWTCRSCPRG